MKKGQPSYFLREATGLIREWSVFDAFEYLVLQAAVPLFFALVYTQGAWMFPSGSLAVAAIFSAVAASFTGFMYVALIAMMPRSGGDYVFNSRIMHPAWGMMVAGGWTVVWQIIWNTLMPGFMATSVFGPWFLTYGSMFKNQALLDLGNWFYTTPAIPIIMVALFAVSFLLHVIGMRGYARVQYFLFAFMCIAFVIPVVALLSIGQAGWQSTFNALVSEQTGTADAYSGVIKAAGSYGFTPSYSLDVSQSLMLMPFIYTPLAFCQWIAENAGETKGASSMKANAKSILGSIWFLTIIIIVTSFTVVYIMGQDFLASLGYLFFEGKPEYGNFLSQPPYLYSLASVAIGNPFLISLLFVGLVATSLNISYNTALAGSRNLMAMAFDRVFFEKSGHVSDRWHFPTYSVLAMYIIPVLLLPVYLYTNFGTLLLGTSVGVTGLFIGTGVSALIIPWKRPDIYKSSAISRYSLAGIPLITIVAFLSIVLTSFDMYILLSNPGFGLVNVPSYVFLALSYLLWIPVYFAFAWYRKKQGIDVSLAFKEIPPE